MLGKDSKRITLLMANFSIKKLHKIMIIIQFILYFFTLINWWNDSSVMPPDSWNPNVFSSISLQKVVVDVTISQENQYAIFEYERNGNGVSFCDNQIDNNDLVCSESSQFIGDEQMSVLLNGDHGYKVEIIRKRIKRKGKESLICIMYRDNYAVLRDCDNPEIIVIKIEGNSALVEKGIERRCVEVPSSRIVYITGHFNNRSYNSKKKFIYSIKGFRNSQTN